MLTYAQSIGAFSLLKEGSKSEDQRRSEGTEGRERQFDLAVFPLYDYGGKVEAPSMRGRGRDICLRERGPLPPMVTLLMGRERERGERGTV